MPARTGRPTVVATAAAAALLCGACAGAGEVAVSPPVYGVPSPAQATYDVTDTLTGSVRVLGTDIDVVAVWSSTLGLAFEAGADGTLVTGTAESFTMSMMSPEEHPNLADETNLEGPLTFVVGPMGHVKVLSFPTVVGVSVPSGADSPFSLNVGDEQESPFEFVAHDFIPRFPDRVVRAGEMWADTVVLPEEERRLMAPETTVYTYTLVGDTVIDGRSLLRIEVSATGGEETSEDVFGLSVSATTSTSTEGFFLWDPERRLVFASEMVRSVEISGSAAELASMNFSLSSALRVRLVG